MKTRAIIFFYRLFAAFALSARILFFAKAQSRKPQPEKGRKIGSEVSVIHSLSKGTKRILGGICLNKSARSEFHEKCIIC
jgi:hypothetical protein